MREPLPELTYDQVRDALPAYALGALEPAEMAAVQHYFEQQALLLQRLAEAEQALVLLPQLAPAAPLPAAIQQTLRQRIQAAEGFVPPTPRPREKGAPPLLPSTPLLPSAATVQRPLALATRQLRPRTGTPGQGTLNPRPAPRATFSASLRTLAWNAMALAALLALVLISLYQLTLQRELTAAQGALVASSRQLAEVTSSLAVLDATNRALQTENDALAAANQQVTAQRQVVDQRVALVGAANRALIMLGTDVAPGLQGTFFLREEQGTGALVVHGLQPLPVDRIYQLWLVTPQGEQLPVSIVTVQENIEPTWININLPTDLPTFTAVGISIEPATGSPQPTGPMLLESVIG